jgi:hypothetical protein
MNNNVMSSSRVWAAKKLKAFAACFLFHIDKDLLKPASLIPS